MLLICTVTSNAGPVGYGILPSSLHVNAEIYMYSLPCTPRDGDGMARLSARLSLYHRRRSSLVPLSFNTEQQTRRIRDKLLGILNK